MRSPLVQVLTPFLLIAFIAISFNSSCLAQSREDSTRSNTASSGSGDEERSKSTNQGTSKSTEQSTSKSTEQSTSESTDQGTSKSAEQSTSKSKDDSEDRKEQEPFNKTLFFAFLEEDQNAVNSVGYEMLKDKPLFKDIIVPHNANERKFRPMLQWRAWADKPQSFLPGLLFLTMISFFFWWLMPRKLQNASTECRANFWKSFGAGGLLSLISIIVTRSIFLTEIGWPLGIALVAFFQGVMLAGLALAIHLLGNSVNRLIKIHASSFFSSRAGALLACDLVVGSVLSALILLIPNLGEIPRIGPRLLALFAILGIGALYRQSRSSSEN